MYFQEYLVKCLNLSILVLSEKKLFSLYLSRDFLENHAKAFAPIKYSRKIQSFFM